MMIERHSPEVWRKTAASLRDDASYAMEGDGRGVNRNGAPLLGDTRDLFRPKPSDIPARPGVYKWRDGEGRVIYVGKAKNLRNRLANYFQPLYQCIRARRPWCLPHVASSGPWSAPNWSR